MPIPSQKMIALQSQADTQITPWRKVSTIVLKDLDEYKKETVKQSVVYD